MLVKFAFQDFLDEKEFRNLSDKTISGYKVLFKEFNNFVTEQGIVDVTDITQSTVKGYLVYCRKERRNNPVSVNTKLKNLKAFFNHLQEQEYIEKNPCVKIQYLETDTQIEVFTDSQIRQMLNYYRRQKNSDRQFAAYRNHTIIIVLLGTGIRRGELCNLKWSDIDMLEKLMQVYGKSRRQETIPITSKVVQELLEYRLYLDSHFEELNEYVFINRYNRHLTENAVNNIFQRLAKKMNFSNVRLSAHTFRHTFAQKFLLNGGDVFSLQKILRHKKLSMTEKYLALWGQQLSAQNDKYNPLNGFDDF
ncbi:tyrosine-type recombinase/integrase [Viridibacillus arvi]|uniref:tyrosine-type recombinase/integrase n=1 Tax=Viridibacillus arvi TaxID=263475 RepID=UPI003D06A9C8